MKSEIQGAVFLRKGKNAYNHLNILKQLEKNLNHEGQDLIRKDIKRLEYGIQGEKNIIFELEASNIPMYVLHDISLTDGEKTSQIDFMVFTHKICFVVECKNMYGNIEIRSDGSFVRKNEYAKQKEEGMYSPISQNEKHLLLIRKIKGNVVKRNFSFLKRNKPEDDRYKDLVVLANHRTVLDYSKAAPNIKEKVIRADQLNNCILKMYNESALKLLGDDELKNWADEFIKAHSKIQKDYTSKYNRYILKDKKNSRHFEEIQKSNVFPKKDNKKSERKEKEIVNTESTKHSRLYEELRAYRYEKSREEGIKPYMMFSNKQLEDLIDKHPDTLKELHQVSGFGEIKVNKYGADILKILQKYI